MKQPEFQYVYITCGLPGAGKTTWAQNMIKTAKNTFSVVGDDLRAMLHGGTYQYSDRIEETVRKAVVSMATNALIYKNDVIIDECILSLTKSDRRYLVSKIRHDIEGRAATELRFILVHFPPAQSQLDRRKADPRGFPVDRWERTWRELEAQYQSPTDTEPFYKIIQPIEVT